MTTIMITHDGGNTWSKARVTDGRKPCHKCGQPRNVHNDEYCETLLKIWGEPAKRRGPKEDLVQFRKEGEPNHAADH